MLGKYISSLSTNSENRVLTLIAIKIVGRRVEYSVALTVILIWFYF